MNKETSSILDLISNVIIGITLFLLPLLFLTSTTDFFLIPKQVLVIFSTSALLIIWGLKSVFEKKIIVNANPLNLPIAIFGIVILVSSILSQNRYDSLLQVIPVLFVIFLFFAIINIVHDSKSFSLVLASYILGAAASAIVTIAYYFKIYFLPIPAIQSQYFNSFGSVLQQLIYLIPVLIFCLFYMGKRLGFPKIKPSNTSGDVGFFVQSLAGIVILVGVILIAYEIAFLPQKPIVLPYIYGFGIAFSSISHEAQRFIVTLLFGSGYGTFLTDFTRFKLPSFNVEANIWSLSFSYSSSYLLELIATTGILGALSFIFMIVGTLRMRTKKNPLFISLFALFVISIILPFSFPTIAEVFVLAAVYVAYLNIEGDKRVYDIVLSLVSKKNGMISFDATPEESAGRKSESPILSGVVFILILAIVGFSAFFTYKFVVSDVEFAQSLIAAQANNGQKTYELQSSAIAAFPYRSDYQRIFSQVNLSLANSLSQSVPQGSSPSADVQQNVVTLLQQSINSGRNAVILSPLTSVNWQNLGQIYRNLIGVGQNAEQFSIASLRQAIALDPYNPQLYIQVGGVYYQLKMWDQAQNEFQIAAELKPDYSNAYYNLGHTLEAKGDLQGALGNYKTVAQLSQGNKQNLDQINKEIAAIEAKIGNNNVQAKDVQPTTNDQSKLEVNGEQPVPSTTPTIKISPPPAGSEGSDASESAK